LFVRGLVLPLPSEPLLAREFSSMSAQPLLRRALCRLSLLLAIGLVASATPDHYVVVRRGATGGFGVVVTSDNIVTDLRGRARDDSLLHLGDVVLEVDGEPLEEPLAALVKRSPSSREALTLGVKRFVPEDDDGGPVPSLGEMMKSMLSNEQFRGAVSKMAVGMIKGGVSGDGSATNLLAAAPQRPLLDGGSAAEAAPTGGSGGELAAPGMAFDEARLEASMNAMMASKGFETLLDRVVESEGVQRMVEGLEKGEVCGDALEPHELQACLLGEGKLLRVVTDSACGAMGLSKHDCEQTHAQAEALLGRLGLGGGDTMAARLAMLLLRMGSRAAAALLLVLLGVAALGVWLCIARWRRGGSGRTRRSEDDVVAKAKSE